MLLRAPLQRNESTNATTLAAQAATVAWISSQGTPHPFSGSSTSVSPDSRAQSRWTLHPARGVSATACPSVAPSNTTSPAVTAVSPVVTTLSSWLPTNATDATTTIVAATSPTPTSTASTAAAATAASSIATKSTTASKSPTTDSGYATHGDHEGEPPALSRSGPVD